jgi:hypothetical protein
VIQYHGILHFSGEVLALLVPFLSLFIYLAFKHGSLIKSFTSLISSHDTESQFVRPRLHETGTNQTGMKIGIVNMFTRDRGTKITKTGMKPNWNETMKPNLKLSTCLHDFCVCVGVKITKFYSPCQAIFFFRWLLLACVVHLFQCQGYIRYRSEMYLCSRSFRSEFMPV